MTDEFKLRKQEERGVRAKALLENDLLIETLEKMESTVLKGWKESKADDHEGRHNAYLMHRLLQNFKEEFKRMAITGEDARKQLLRTQDPTLLQRMKRNV